MSLSPIRTLIADDNTDFANILDVFLSQTNDIEVVGTAADGIEAVGLIKALEPDIVLLDIILPELDGLGVLSEIKAARMEKEPQFFMISALDNEINSRKASELGASCFFMKPFDLYELRNRIIATF